MTPGELENELTEWVVAHEANQGTNAEGEVLSECGEFAIRNYDVISKSLRFAADMEVLMPRDPEFLISAKTSQVRLSILDAGERIYFIGTDYYTAARKAVQALEGGK